MRKWTSKWDPWVLLWASLATMIGLVAIYLAEYPKALERGSFIPWEFRNQLAYAIVAVGAGLATSKLGGKAFRRLAIPLWVLSLAALLVVEFFGAYQNGAKRWINLGGVMIQPAEFVKLTCILYLAHVLADRPKWPSRIPKFSSFAKKFDIVWSAKIKRLMPAVLVFVAVYLIEHEPDLGTAAIVAVTALSMFLSGGVHWKTLAWGTGLSVLLLGLAVWKQPYRLERFEVHNTRWEAQKLDSLGFQTVRSEVAMAQGGLLGVGIGGGQVKFVMPAAHTDFVMATISEEGGAVTALFVIGVLAALSLRLATLARDCKEAFPRLVLNGTAWWLTVQTVTNVVMANGSFPAIGIPLPFVSFGGSSLIALWMCLGMTQGVLASASKPKEAEEVVTDSHGWRHGRPYLPRA